MHHRAIIGALLTAVLCGTAAAAEDDALYDIPLREDQALIWITVVNQSDEPMAGIAVEVIRVGTATRFTKKTDANGHIPLIVPTGGTYDIRFWSPNGAGVGKTERFVIDDTPEQRYTLEMVYKAKTQRGFSFNNIVFPRRSAKVPPKARNSLKALAQYMELRPEVYVEIIAYGDTRTDDPDDILLAQRRADALKHYLLSLGIAAHRVVARGNDDPSAANPRRVRVDIHGE